jgi:hypothetical protein
MSAQGKCVRIDVLMSDDAERENSGTGPNQPRVKYIAIDKVRSVSVSKTYTKSSQQNSIDFINHLMSQKALPMRVICTDNGSMFQREFEKHLMKLGLRHERLSPHTIDDPDWDKELK